jgi:predicted adenylyl cyclase CyaB
MARNVEIKARLTSRDELLRLITQLAHLPSEHFQQTDVFFAVPRGRLKLRRIASNRGELIQYERDDVSGPKLSSYSIVHTSEPAALEAALTAVFDVIGTVRKQRVVFHHGQTRVHLDEVEGLGEFVELEVVLRDGQSEQEGASIAQKIMAELGIGPERLITGAYIDLLRQR